MRTGNLFVISGPSGTGKGTLIARVLKEVPDAWLSVSATTRRPRPGEEEGVSYYFLTKEEFLSLADEGGFLEWATYSENCYGTPRASVEREMAAGRQVILEIEVQGALQVRAKMPEAHLVFIEPPSLEELERRLRGRGTETDDVVEMRMSAALVELSHKMEYDYRLVNDDLDEATRQLVAYINEVAEQ
ncbi:MAG: guanylate kinase [Adlercreutzia sp.]|uniref:guanylate kinase n=1 Tax=uncultured Adlercreutzia sp. TaxID=875803 RepID=UPI0021730271|nr:guanylate kinase [uncultured Adlercreutzia sp.]MCI8424592.1 guanylate kinase [Adlercreutzia sp.]